MTWAKLTREALFLMTENSYLDRVALTPNGTTPNSFKLDIPVSWFSGAVPPGRLVVSMNSPEPEPAQIETPFSTVLSEDDYDEAAGALGVPIAVLKAVAEVESSGGGFLKDGRPKILFEAHWFSRFTDHKHDSSHPNISSRKWNKKLYKGGTKEWDRLAEAKSLDSSAALKSASWGLFQIMGFNHKQAGFATVEKYVDAMEESENRQLLAFVEFLRQRELDKPLKALDWRTFARFYNGSGQVDFYAKRLKAAHDRQ